MTIIRNITIKTDGSDHFVMICPNCKDFVNIIEVDNYKGRELFIYTECPKCHHKGKRKTLYKPVGSYHKSFFELYKD